MENSRKRFQESYAVGPALEQIPLALPAMLDQSAAKHRQEDAMIFYGRHITYEEFQRATYAVAFALAGLGLAKGDRVAVMLPNCPHYVISFYGVTRLGGVVVQLNPMYTEREIGFILSDSGATAVITLDALVPRVLAADTAVQVKKIVQVSLAPQAAGPVGDDERVMLWDAFLGWGAQHRAVFAPDLIDPVRDPAALQYTGGTTGRSKGAVLTHHNLTINAIQVYAHCPPGICQPGDRILTAIPLFHIYGASAAMNFSVYTGSALILVPRFEIQEILDLVKQYKPTHFPGVPTMYVALANHPKASEYGVDSIRVCNSGSAPLPVEVMQRFEEVTGAIMIEGFGLTEASPVTHLNPYERRKPGSVGVPVPGTEVAIVDVETGSRRLPIGETGELIVKGPQVMQGYLNLPDETATALRDGWLYTGDIARMDEDGFTFIVDRKKDMIIVSGFNVYPRDVEEVLYMHPAILEAVVIGVPDGYQGEAVKAYLVIKPGATLDQAELEVFCRARLAAYKVPKQIEVREALPKSAIGKVLRRQLRTEQAGQTK